MTKEEWLIVRSKEEIPMHVFFEAYKEQNGLIPDITNFERILCNLIAQRIPVINSKNVPIFITFESVILKTYSYFDKKFGTVF